MTEREFKLADALAEMVDQADEDTPQGDRTSHFRDHMSECRDLIKEMGYYDYDKFLSDSSDDHPKYSDGIKDNE